MNFITKKSLTNKNLNFKKFEETQKYLYSLLNFINLIQSNEWLALKKFTWKNSFRNCSCRHKNIMENSLTFFFLQLNVFNDYSRKSLLKCASKYYILHWIVVVNVCSKLAEFTFDPNGTLYFAWMLFSPTDSYVSSARVWHFEWQFLKS